MKSIVYLFAGFCLLITNLTMAAMPPKNILVVRSTDRTSNLHWSNSGKEILIIAAPVSIKEDDAVPEKGMFYSADPKYGTGSKINNGFVVYKGKENSITITSLELSTSYYFSAYEADANGDFTIPGPQLTSFICMTHGTKAHLAWKSSGELTNDKVIVERSFDSKTWTSVENGGAFPMSKGVQGVNFYDKGPLNSDCYYRLKHIYQNKETVISQPLLFRSFTMDAVFIVSSPETHDGKTYSIFSDKETNLTITNSKGEMVKQLTLNDKNSYTFTLHNFPAGIYNISGSNSAGILNEKVTVKE